MDAVRASGRVRRVACLLFAALAGACAAKFTEPVNVRLTSRSDAIVALTPPEVAGDTVVIVAFSGGGTRAAAFAHGTMLGLNRLRAFDKVVAYSGVSGGSVAAAYYGLRGRTALGDFRERFLLKNAEEDLETNVNLANLGTGLQGGVNDATRFSGWLDKNLFDGARLSDVFGQGKPLVAINASDLYNRTPFLFGPVMFGALCSDPRQYPLSLAVAASAAVPVAFVPIVLANFPEDCQAELPPWVERVLADPNAGAKVKAAALAFKSYRDPEQLRFVKLADGGLTDNFGLSGMVIARESTNRPYAPFSPNTVVRSRRVLFIVVNAGGESSAPWTTTLDGPSGKALIGAITDTAIDAAVRSGFDAFRLTIREWEAAARKWRCGLSRAEATRLGASKDWHCSLIKFDIAEIAFDQLDPKRASMLSKIPTRFQLPAEQVDSLISGGSDAVTSNPIVRSALVK